MIKPNIRLKFDEQGLMIIDSEVRRAIKNRCLSVIAAKLERAIPAKMGVGTIIKVDYTTSLNHTEAGGYLQFDEYE